MIHVICTADYEEMSRKAADRIAAQILLKPDCVLGLPTGSTPEGVYSELVRKHREEGLDFGRVRTVNLDEYAGLKGEDRQSYRFFMNSRLFSHVNILPENTFLPDGTADDLRKVCEDYDALIRHLGGLDLLLLGIGVNGHIGFNEPGDSFIAGTHVAALTGSTRRANARLFESPEEVPRTAVTIGLAAIMQARRILLIASGEAKARALKEALQGPVVPALPASILQLHRDVTVIADAEALGTDR